MIDLGDFEVNSDLYDGSLELECPASCGRIIELSSGTTVSGIIDMARKHVREHHPDEIWVSRG